MPFAESWYPREILVRDQVWKVRFRKRLPYNWMIGFCCGESNTIFVRKGLDPARRFTVFLHEVSHAIEYEYDVEFDHTTLNGLDLHLARVLRSNRAPGKRSARPKPAPRREAGRPPASASRSAREAGQKNKKRGRKP